MTRIILRLIVIVAVGACLIATHAANAAIWTVNKTADTDDGQCTATDCSLREAIDAASPGDIIFFSSLFNSPRTIHLNQAWLQINKAITIAGPGADHLTIDGSGIIYSSNGVFTVLNVPGTVALSGMKVSGGPSSGLYVAGVSNDGDLNVWDCLITENGGGGVTNRGYLSMERCAITQNSGYTGGITNVFYSSFMSLDNCTISGNAGDSIFDNAGGILDGGSSEITNCTIVNNVNLSQRWAGEIVDEISYPTPTTTTIRSTIVAGNTDVNGDPADLDGEFVSGGFNFIGADDSVSGFTSQGDQTGIDANPLDPMLDPLGYYGGPTPTHRLQSTSPCIDAGNSFGDTTDQRGYTRPVDLSSVVNAAGGDGSDIGAFERQYSFVAVIGTFVDPKGRPLPGAHVFLRAPSGLTLETTTNHNGMFRFTNVRSFTTYLIGGRHGNLQADPMPVTVPPDGIQDLVLHANR